MSIRWVVDRIEGEVAVLEAGRRYLTLPLEILPGGLQEGGWVELRSVHRHQQKHSDPSLSFGVPRVSAPPEEQPVAPAPVTAPQSPEAGEAEAILERLKKRFSQGPESIDL